MSRDVLTIIIDSNEINNYDLGMRFEGYQTCMIPLINVRNYKMIKETSIDDLVIDNLIKFFSKIGDVIVIHDINSSLSHRIKRYKDVIGIGCEFGDKSSYDILIKGMIDNYLDNHYYSFLDYDEIYVVDSNIVINNEHEFLSRLNSYDSSAFITFDELTDNGTCEVTSDDSIVFNSYCNRFSGIARFYYEYFNIFIDQVTYEPESWHNVLFNLINNRSDIFRMKEINLDPNIILNINSVKDVICV